MPKKQTPWRKKEAEKAKQPQVTIDQMLQAGVQVAHQLSSHTRGMINILKNPKTKIKGDVAEMMRNLTIALENAENALMRSNMTMAMYQETQKEKVEDTPKEAAK